MSKITASAEIDQVKAEDVQRFTDIFCHDVADTVNGKLDFENNFDCKVIDVSFLAANTDTSVSHGLGRVPSRYFPISKSAACDVYAGTAPSTSSTLILKGSAIATVTLVVF